MYFYDSNSKLIRVPITEKISHPLNSHRVYKTADGRCLKRFRVFPFSSPSLDFDQKIQTLRLKHFYTIDEYLFNKSGEYRAFLMPFYESRTDDILLYSSDYLTDNFMEIFDAYDVLSDAGIMARDVNLENTIFTEQDIIMIDAERYCEDVEEITTLKTDNYQEASWLLFSTLMTAATKHSELQDINLQEWFLTQDGRELCCSLSRYKYPIDYLQKVKQKLK